MTLDMRDNKFGLPPGNWRFDPATRVQVWVPDDPNEVGDDSFDEMESSFTNRCPDCNKGIRDDSLRCLPCSKAHRAAGAKRRRKPKPLRPAANVNDKRVQLVLDGQRTKCSRPERIEVLRRWSELGRSDDELAELTGWNVPSYRKHIESLNEKDHAA
jgi:hypothetical protein